MLCLLAPITPHITHHLWQELKFSGDLIDTPWPEVDSQVLEQDNIDIIIQVNGKYRAKITIAKDTNEETIKQAAVNCDNVKRFIDVNNVKKIIVVKNKLVNIVC